MDYTTVQIDKLVELAMTYNDSTKLEGIKAVRMNSAMMAVQMYIICDNGDVIQLIYEFGSRKIYATLVGLHRSNNAHIPVCRDEIARKDLIDNLMSEISCPVLSSDPTSCYMEFPGYAFRHRGHAVYYLKCVNMDIRMITRSFRRIIEDVLHMHKDGTLLDIADMKEGRVRVHKEITKEWVLC